MIYKENYGGVTSMKKVLVVLLSSTSAFSLKSLLEKRFKIHSSIVQAPKELSYLGCTYCLEIDAYDMAQAVNIIKVSGVSSKGVYDAQTYEKLY